MTGDLITPHANSPLVNIRCQYIVLELCERVNLGLEIANLNEVKYFRFGAKRHFRFASVCNRHHGDVKALREDSWMFEPWSPSAEASEPVP